MTDSVMLGSQSEAFFESRYRACHDPWQFATSAYELDRYRATLAALSRPTYRRAYEPGCSVGVLTAELAHRVDRLIACDLSPTAVARARERCREFSHIEIYRGNAAAVPPGGPFDLMVFSELGYYFSADRLALIAGQMAEELEPGGEFLAVHWLGSSADHLLHGDEVHAVLARTLPGTILTSSRHAGFRIDSWRRT
jgi:SAM-dependent methyltransferase